MDQTNKTRPTFNSRPRKRAERLRLLLSNFVEAVANAEGIKLDLSEEKHSPQLMTAKQAGNFLNLAPKTLANWRTLGTGPAFKKMGGKCLYLREDLLAFAHSRTFSSTSAYAPMPENKGAS